MSRSNFRFDLVCSTLPSAGLLCLFLGKEDDEDDEENGENEKDLDHQPSVRGDRLEVFEDFCVSGLNVQLCVFHIGINPERRGEKEGRHGCQISFPLFLRRMKMRYGS